MEFEGVKTQIYSATALSFFLMRKAAVPPINVPIAVKGSGTFWLGGIGLFAVIFTAYKLSSENLFVNVELKLIKALLIIALE